MVLGKRSASGRRHLPGSGGQVANPAGAVHRLVLWAGDLSTAGATNLSRRGPQRIENRRWLSKAGAVVPALESPGARVHDPEAMPSLSDHRRAQRAVCVGPPPRRPRPVAAASRAAFWRSSRVARGSEILRVTGDTLACGDVSHNRVKRLVVTSALRSGMMRSMANGALPTDKPYLMDEDEFVARLSAASIEGRGRGAVCSAWCATAGCTLRALRWPSVRSAAARGRPHEAGRPA